MNNCIDKNNIDNCILRQSILNWYEFKPDTKLLYIGDEDSVLIELFSRRVSSVEVTKDIPSMFHKAAEKSHGVFDYIVWLEGLEESKNPIQDVSYLNSLLSSSGKLLLGVENRFGLKYFCGSNDKYSGIPFDGINGYINSDDSQRGRCYSKKEIKNILMAAGTSEYKFYYPVPDNRMPQMIYTDKYQKGINAAERLIDYNYQDASMIGIEHRIFSQMIDEGALPFMSNFFLIEIAKDGLFSDINYAVVTTDRGKELGMATTVRTNNMVYKRPIWNEGTANIKALYDKTLYLREKNIPIVDTKLEEDSCGIYISMPYVDKEGLSTSLEAMSGGDEEKFLEIFDRIYEYIKASYDEENKSVYIDLAPCNAFYDEDKDDIIFYDQEFVLAESTPKFSMFRTLKYFFASSPKARTNVSIDKMYNRYGIDDNAINEFEQQEALFIQSVRNKNEFEWLYKMATPNYKKIERNMSKHVEKNKPYKIGYVPGVYDLFHVGHLRLLERCKERCDYLIVGVLTDELVEFYKNKRPIISYENRAGVIKGLAVVDEVIPVDFSNTDKLDAWEQLHYDCHFSGDDHVGHWNDIMEELRKRGSNMEFFSYTEGISSTAIRNKMKV